MFDLVRPMVNLFLEKFQRHVSALELVARNEKTNSNLGSSDQSIRYKRSMKVPKTLACNKEIYPYQRKH